MSRTEFHTISKSIRFGENIGEFTQRIKKNGARKPQRTLKELAEEFGVTPQFLSAQLRKDKNGPRPTHATLTNSIRNTWFRADEVRKWWKDNQS